MKNINKVQRIYFIFLAIILVIVCFSFGKTAEAGNQKEFGD